jgi:hypothetical protein
VPKRLAPGSLRAPGRQRARAVGRVAPRRAAPKRVQPVVEALPAQREPQRLADGAAAVAVRVLRRAAHGDKVSCPRAYFARRGYSQGSRAFS